MRRAVFCAKRDVLSSLRDVSVKKQKVSLPIALRKLNCGCLPYKNTGQNAQTVCLKHRKTQNTDRRATTAHLLEALRKIQILMIQSCECSPHSFLLPLNRRILCAKQNDGDIVSPILLVFASVLLFFNASPIITHIHWDLGPIIASHSSLRLSLMHVQLQRNWNTTHNLTHTQTQDTSSSLHAVLKTNVCSSPAFLCGTNKTHVDRLQITNIIHHGNTNTQSEGFWGRFICGQRWSQGHCRFSYMRQKCVCVCCMGGVKQVTFSFCFLKWRNLLKICNSLQSADNNATSVTLVISERQAGTTEMSERVARVRGCKTCDTRSTEGVLCSFTFWVCLLIITLLWVRTYLPSPRTWCFHNLSDCGLCKNYHDNLHESQLRGAAWKQEKSTESFIGLKLKKFSQMRYERLEPPHNPILDKWLRKWVD